MKKRKQRAEEEKAINGVAITCMVILLILAVLTYIAPSMSDKGFKSVIENFASPFAFPLIFFLIESVRDQQKQDEDIEE